MFTGTLSLAHYKKYQVRPGGLAEWNTVRPYRNFWWPFNRWDSKERGPIIHEQRKEVQPSTITKPTQTNQPKNNGGYSPYKAGYGAFRGRRSTELLKEKINSKNHKNKTVRKRIFERFV